MSAICWGGWSEGAYLIFILIHPFLFSKAFFSLSKWSSLILTKNWMEPPLEESSRGVEKCDLDSFLFSSVPFFYLEEALFFFAASFSTGDRTVWMDPNEEQLQARVKFGCQKVSSSQNSIREEEASPSPFARPFFRSFVLSFFLSFFPSFFLSLLLLFLCFSLSVRPRASHRTDDPREKRKKKKKEETFTLLALKCQPCFDRKHHPWTGIFFSPAPRDKTQFFRSLFCAKRNVILWPALRVLPQQESRKRSWRKGKRSLCRNKLLNRSRLFPFCLYPQTELCAGDSSFKKVN